MQSYEQYTNKEALNEVLITFGGKAYPKFGQIVILAGGAGSGKGFVVSNLLGVEGKIFDVDQLKGMAIASNKLASRVKRDMGVELSKLDLRKPDNVSQLHLLLGGDEINLDKRYKSAFFKSVLSSHPDRKPNMIFDVTLKNFSKVTSIAKKADELGYDKKNIHIVWVVNDIEVAIEQNAKRSRVVPSNILLGTHQGASKTMASIIKDVGKIQKYADGDIWLAFNKAGKDSKLVMGDKKNNVVIPSKELSAGKFLEKAFIRKMKKSGSSVDSGYSAKLLKFISKYVPNPEEWEQLIVHKKKVSKAARKSV